MNKVLIIFFILFITSCTASPYLEISAGYGYPINGADRFGINEEAIAVHAAIGVDFTERTFCEIRHRSTLNRSPEIQLYDATCGFKIGGK